MRIIFKNGYIPLFILVIFNLHSCKNNESISSTENSTDSSTEIHSRPNLLIIISDQWRGQALGFLNEDPVMTPRLDSLAKHSLVLNNFISNYPICSPARAMLMSGQYPFTNQVYAICNSKTAPYDVELPAHTVTWSDVLAKNGYALGYIGKWHLDAPHAPYIPTYNDMGPIKWNEWTPPDRRHGFSYWYAYGTYDRHLRPMYWSTDASRMDFHYENKWEPQEDVDKAIAFLKNKNDEYRKEGNPFALVVSMNPPHTVYTQIPEKYYNLYKNIPVDSLVKDPDILPAGTKWGDYYRKYVKYYYAAITGVDEQIGRLLAALKQNGLSDNTIILFMSDHGNSLGKHKEKTKNNFYEESLRIPFMLSWEGHIRPRVDSACLMSMVDIYPTLLGMMGLESKIPSGVQGKSWAPYLLTGSGDYPTSQFFMGRVRPDGLGGFRGIRTKRYKLVYRVKGNTMKKYLFDRKNDPFEMNNIYGQLLKVTSRLKNELINQLTRRAKDPFLKNLK